MTQRKTIQVHLKEYINVKQSWELLTQPWLHRIIDCVNNLPLITKATITKVILKANTDWQYISFFLAPQYEIWTLGSSDITDHEGRFTKQTMTIWQQDPQNIWGPQSIFIQ